MAAAPCRDEKGLNFRVVGDDKVSLGPELYVRLI